MNFLIFYLYILNLKKRQDSYYSFDQKFIISSKYLSLVDVFQKTIQARDLQAFF